MELALPFLSNHWLEQHPVMFWMVEHPIISIVAILIGIILFSRLLSAIAYLIDKVWLWIIKAPWLLIKSIFGIKKKIPEEVGNTINYEIATNPEQLTEIVRKLERIEQQQQQILQDIASLKGQTKVTDAQKSVLTLPEENS